jgi:hypothetical protein
LPADPELIAGLFGGLTNLTINWDFSSDVVNEAGLPQFGLAKPVCEYLLKQSGTNTSGAATNIAMADIQFGFGTNQADRVYARRTDESSVYAISTNDFARLPSVGWTLRERKFWDFTEDDVARLTIQRQTNTWELVHKGPHEWSMASGQGILMNDLGAEQAVRGLVRASAIAWTARGETNRLRCGFADTSFTLAFELKSGRKEAIEFGGRAPSGSHYAAIQINGQLWICEFPADLYQLVEYGLRIR